MPEPTRQSRSGELAHRACACRGDPPGVEPALEQHRGRDRVDHLAPALSPDAAFDERPLGDRRREALIPELDRSRSCAVRARPRTPRALSAAVTLAAVQPARQPDHHAVHLAIFHLARDARPERSRLVGNCRKRRGDACRSRRRPPVRSGPSRRRCRGRACGRYRPRPASRRLGSADERRSSRRSRSATREAAGRRA